MSDHGTDLHPTTGDLATSMADVARLLERETGVAETWSAIARIAVDRIERVDHVGITVITRGQVRSEAASSDLPVQVDAVQAELDEGPCLDALRDHETYRTGDLGHEVARWPTFGPRVARDLDVHSMLSFRMFVQDDTLGAFNFYSHEHDAFDDEVARAGSVFAAHASLALVRAREHDKVLNLEKALDSSRTIGAACGILMSQHHLTEEQAFAVLKTYSQNSNRKLRDVADDVVHTGVLPEQVRARTRR